MVDDHTRMTWIHLMKQKSDAYETLYAFINMAKTQHNKIVKVVRSDNAVELDDKLCRPMFHSLGIIHQTSCVDTPEQNGRVERRHRNHLEMARALKLQAGVPDQLWGDCVLAAAHITNRLPTPTLKNKSPYEVLTNTKPNYDLLKTFGCFVIAYNPAKTCDKFAMRGVPCIFLGYPSTQKGYRLFNLLNNTTFVTRHTKFFEHLFPYQVFKNKSQPITQNTHENSRQWYETEADTNLSTPHHQTVSDPPDTDVDNLNDPLDIEPSSPPPAVRRSDRIHKPPTWLGEYHTNLAHSNPPKPAQKIFTLPTSSTFWCFSANLTKHTDHLYFKQAVKDPNWVTAMNKELDALELNDTWDITPLPVGKKAIWCKWIYKHKYNPDGTLARHKSRLVVFGDKSLLYIVFRCI